MVKVQLGRHRLTADIDGEVWKTLKRLAAAHNQSLTGYVESLIRQADRPKKPLGTADWVDTLSRLWQSTDGLRWILISAKVTMPDSDNPYREVCLVPEGCSDSIDDYEKRVRVSEANLHLHYTPINDKDDGK